MESKPQKFWIATNTAVVSEPGKKPDFGPPIWADKNESQKFVSEQLTYRFSNRNLTAGQIADQVLGKGGTITTCHTGGSKCAYLPTSGKPHTCRSATHRHAKNFTRAQHLGADFDNLQDSFDVYYHPIVRCYGSIIYHTPSSTATKPKMRVIFLLDQAIEDATYYRQVVKALLWKFEQTADPSCSDPCRLFFGNKGCEPVVTGKVLPLEVGKSWVADWLVHEAQTRPAITAAPPLPAQLTAAQEKRKVAFSKAVLDRAASEIVAAAKGGRHYELKKKATNVFSFVWGGVIDRYEARQVLETAYAAHNPNKAEMKDLLDWCETHARSLAQGLPEQPIDLKKYQCQNKYKPDNQNQSYFARKARLLAELNNASTTGTGVTVRTRTRTA